VDVLIDMDHRTDFLRHFLHYGAAESRLPAAERRRNSLAALIAIGCNIGPQRMAVASGLRVREISEVADWYLSADALKAASSVRASLSKMRRNPATRTRPSGWPVCNRQGSSTASLRRQHWLASLESAD